MSNLYEEILNQIVEALLPKLNGALGGAIRSRGLDPYQQVASGSKGFGIGTVHYSVTHLTGLSSLDITEAHVSNVGGDPENLTGDIAINVVLRSSLAANISGGVTIPLINPSISGHLAVNKPTLAGAGTFSASLTGTKMCINSINLTSADFNYSDASATINGAGIINDILKPLENLILDAVKSDIRGLISGPIKNAINSEAGGQLPQCKDM